MHAADSDDVATQPAYSDDDTPSTRAATTMMRPESIHTPMTTMGSTACTSNDDESIRTADSDTWCALACLTHMHLVKNNLTFGGAQYIATAGRLGVRCNRIEYRIE